MAGRFYPADPRKLEASVRSCLGAHPGGEVRAFALMAPHAGYVYSGAIAGETYSRVRVPGRAIVLCPNHTGRGARKSVTSASAWRLPGGDVPIDESLRDLLVSEAGLTSDAAAHEFEHSAEVQLPFLRAKNPDVAAVAICLGGLSFRECEEIGLGLARVLRGLGPGDPRDTLVVASSDMSHYLPAGVARQLDSLALDRVLALDPRGLYDVVRDRDISMCGFLPVTTALVCARELGAKRAELVRYGNSGEVSGDNDQVVGYAGVVVT